MTCFLAAFHVSMISLNEKKSTIPSDVRYSSPLKYRVFWIAANFFLLILLAQISDFHLSHTGLSKFSQSILIKAMRRVLSAFAQFVGSCFMDF